MRKLLFYFLILGFILPEVVSAQYYNRNRYEWVFGLGATNFLGDIGGSSTQGTHFIKDFNFGSTREMGSVGLRYMLSDYMAVKGGLYFGMLRGNDALSSEKDRHNRNINFRSPIVEISGQYEVYFNKEQVGHRYHIRHAHGMHNINIQGYAFVGIGAFFFNPQGYYQGNWYNLRPLSTEGEGFIPGRKNYSLTQFSIPFGAGVKMPLSENINVGFEIGYRKLFTDYLDDVSKTYVDPNLLLANRGAKAVELSYRGNELKTGSTIYPTGGQRGNPGYKDWYYFTGLTLSFRLGNSLFGNGGGGGKNEWDCPKNVL